MRFDVPAKVGQYTKSVLLSAKRRGARVMLVLTDSETEILKDMRRTEVELEENELGENARVQPQKVRIRKFWWDFKKTNIFQLIFSF